MKIVYRLMTGTSVTDLGVFLKGGEDGVISFEAAFLGPFQGVEHTFVVGWHDLEELGGFLLPVVENVAALTLPV